MSPLSIQRQVGSWLPILGKYQEQIDKALKLTLQTRTSPIVKLLQYHMGWVDKYGVSVNNPTGKAIRPSLCLFTCQAVGGKPDKALMVAVALEFIHNFSLIHDDIQDEDTDRHHRPTLWFEWGKSKALLAGNVMRVLGEQAILPSKAPKIAPKDRLACISVLTESYLEMIEGQYLDLSYEERQDVTPEEYLEMVSKKTGALMGASMHLGAILGTQDTSKINALRHAGQELGMAFQCRDDLLGIWGETAKTGKAVGADIIRKKKSLPIIYAFQKASGPKKRKLNSIYRNPEINAQEVNEVLEILNDFNAATYTQSIANQRNASAMRWIEEAHLDSIFEAALKQICDFVTNRNY